MQTPDNSKIINARADIDNTQVGSTAKWVMSVCI